MCPAMQIIFKGKQVIVACKTLTISKLKISVFFFIKIEAHFCFDVQFPIKIIMYENFICCLDHPLQ